MSNDNERGQRAPIEIDAPRGSHSTECHWLSSQNIKLLCDMVMTREPREVSSNPVRAGVSQRRLTPLYSSTDAK